MAKDIDWGNLPFNYMETSKSFVSIFKDGKWDEAEEILPSHRGS